MKRTGDILGASFLLLLGLPAMLVAAIAIRVTIGSPILFRQIRPGLHGTPFRMVKFRTMSEDVEPNGQMSPDRERLTTIGRFLRATSLDELPELWNVLKGDMSLIGPRPLLMEYLSLYSHEQARRHEVKPGLTGWAQVNGRNDVSWEQRLKMDVWYVDNWSTWLDFKVILMTVVGVLSRKGINATGEATMHKFKGTGH